MHERNIVLKEICVKFFDSDLKESFTPRPFSVCDYAGEVSDYLTWRKTRASDGGRLGEPPVEVISKNFDLLIMRQHRRKISF